MHKYWVWLKDYWSLNLTSLIGILIFAGLLVYKLAIVPTGYSPSELAIHYNLIHHTYSLNYLLQHPLFFPYTFGLYIIQSLHFYGILAIRSVGAFFGLISGVIFFYIIWRWYGLLVSILSTALFISGLWFLTSARNNGTTILYVTAALVVMLLGFVVRNIKRHSIKTILAAILGVFLLYIPGMIWFIAIICVLQRKYVANELSKTPFKFKVIMFVIALVLVTPLVYALLRDTSQLKMVLGLPTHVSFKAFLTNFKNWPLKIFIYNPHPSKLALGRLPILELFSSVMIILGLYWGYLKRGLDRIMLILAATAIAWILYSLGGVVPIVLALPFILCLVATGITFLIGQWFTVFPKNPIARIFGVSLLSIAVAVVCFYHLNQYFLAWPHTDSVMSVYIKR